MAHVLIEDIGYLYREPDRHLTEQEQQKFSELVNRRAAREPLSHLTGHREFWSLDFRVSSDVLDPRSDSETLIEAVSALTKEGNAPQSVLDLGTGSGCLLLAILSELPAATGVGIDVSEAALRIAADNAKRLGMEDRAEFRHGSWDIDFDRRFDLVISNPPYIPTADIKELQTEVREYEPRLALDGGQDGLDCYRAILANVRNLLRLGGLLVFEVGIGQAPDVGQLMTKVGFHSPAFHRDIAGVERCVSAFLRN
jgi:release factor glutamine methyltransferase